MRTWPVADWVVFLAALATFLGALGAFVISIINALKKIDAKVDKVVVATDGSLSEVKAINTNLRDIGEIKDERIKSLEATIQQKDQERERLALTTAMVTGNGPKVPEPAPVEVVNSEPVPVILKRDQIG